MGAHDGQIAVLSGPERQKRWSDELQLQILMEALASGGCHTDLAPGYEISTVQLHTWRNKVAVEAVPASAMIGFKSLLPPSCIPEDRPFLSPR